ncbi:MAG: hypothetical protein AMXMBFR4_11140 [Candidatus Hydrogenedentota bacterium]
MVAVLIVAPRSAAHDLELFATSEDHVIKGRVYLSDTPAKHVQVRLTDSAGGEISTALSDDSGQFTFDVGDAPWHRLIAETVDGHRAELVVQSDRHHDSHDDAAPLPGAHEDGIRAAVRDAVQPLQEQLAQLERKTRTRDIVAGIGYIVGIAGLWVLLRRPRARG